MNDGVLLIEQAKPTTLKASKTLRLCKVCEEGLSWALHLDKVLGSRDFYFDQHDFNDCKETCLLCSAFCIISADLDPEDAWIGHMHVARRE